MALRVDLNVAARLALCFFLGYALFTRGHFSGTDELSVYQSAAALFDSGSLAVEKGPPHNAVGADGRTYSVFAVGQSLLALPWYALGAGAEALLPGSWTRALIGREFRQTVDSFESPKTLAVSLYPPLASAVLVAVFFLFQRQLGVGLRAALGVSTLFGVATQAAMMSTYFLRHATEAVAILGAFAALHAFGRDGRPRQLLLGSLLASLTLLIRVPAALAVPPLAGYALWQLGRRRRAGQGPSPGAALAAGLVPGLGVLLIHGALNRLRWGSWLASPMLEQVHDLTTPLQVGVTGLLVGPGTGLLVYSPPLLLLPWALPRFWRSHRAECVTLLALGLTFLLVMGRFRFWHGLWSAPGPRMLFATLPLWMLPLGPWLEAQRTRRARLWAAGLAAIGAGLQLLLLLPRWHAVIAGMGWWDHRPPFGFLFELAQSPFVGSLRALGAGEIDLWLWSLWTGAPGRAPAPWTAVALGGLWIAALALAVARLRHAVARAPQGAGAAR